MPSIFAVSDTHNSHRSVRLRAADIFVYAGDFSMAGTLGDVVRFNDWLADVPAPIKIVIAGNHDLALQRDPITAKALLTNVDHYLLDSSCEVMGLKFYGSPWVPGLSAERHAFVYGRHHGDARRIWDKIPTDTDVLVTHGPPYGVLDLCPDFRNRFVHTHVGCNVLKKVLRERPNIRHHIFGHIHEGKGELADKTGRISHNVCGLNGRYQPYHKGTLIHV